MSLPQCPWDLGSGPAERVGQGEVGAPEGYKQHGCLCVGLAVESPWLALGGPFLFSFAQMGLEQSSGQFGK